MSESTKSDLSETSRQNKHGNTDNAGKAKKSTKNIAFTLLGVACCLSAIGSICLAGILWWQQQQLQQQLQQQQQFQQQQQKAENATIKQIELNKQNTVQESILNDHALILKKLQQEVAENRQNFLHTDGRIRQLQINSEQTWKISEFEYLLRTASLLLQTERNVTNAIRLLKQAKKILDTIDDSEILFVKKILNEDIVALDNTTFTDITDYWSQLNVLFVQIQDLPVLAKDDFDTHPHEDNPEAIKKDAVVLEADNKKPVTWEDRIKKMLLDSWRFFSDQFYFRKNEQTVSFLLSPKEEIQLKANISLMLIQAQQALLIGNKTIYQQSLSNVINLFTTWFHNNSTKAKSILFQLEALQKVDIVPRLPTVSRVLKELKIYKEQINNQYHLGNTTIVTKNSAADSAAEKIQNANKSDSSEQQQSPSNEQTNKEKTGDQHHNVKEETPKKGGDKGEATVQ
ncbi:MAG: uroporphyrinogen-III C-methyltransferase [Endozoicomonadaceae bacterium]|nr:uroporphyrinogen-III C-methyltransferase [Endozoicomonadaceae bacterium]